MAIVVSDNSNPALEMPTIVPAPSDSAVEMPTIVPVPSVSALEMPTIVPAPSNSGRNMHKNYLQEYTQKSGLPLPSYSTFIEGQSHVPKFRATVVVDGVSITSPNAFSHRKESEQDVARIALECISLKFKNEGSHYIHKDPVFCKLILNEYSSKFKIDKPTYSTTQQKGLLPTFITTVIFGGKTYVGHVGKCKKEAEQNAACSVIDTILASSNDGNAMAQIIKTKGKLYAAVSSDANVGNSVTRSGSENVGANDVNRGSEVIAIPTNGKLSVGSASSVPHISCVNVAQSNQVNYQIPYLGLPATVVNSQAINPKKRNKRSKKKWQGDQSKRVRVDEQLQNGKVRCVCGATT